MEIEEREKINQWRNLKEIEEVLFLLKNVDVEMDIEEIEGEQPEFIYILPKAPLPRPMVLRKAYEDVNL